MSLEPLQEAIQFAGGQAGLARAIRALMPGSKISQQLVWKWLNAAKNEVPPAEYVIPIAATTGWKITPHVLRPDIYPHPQDGIPAADRTQEAA